MHVTYFLDLIYILMANSIKVFQRGWRLLSTQGFPINNSNRKQVSGSILVDYKPSIPNIYMYMYLPNIIKISHRV